MTGNFSFSPVRDPHITLITGTASIANHLKRGFIYMNQIRTGQHFVKLFIENVQRNLFGAHHPVGQGVGLQHDTAVLIAAELSVQEQVVIIFSVDDGSYRRRRGNAVAEEIR